MSIAQKLRKPLIVDRQIEGFGTVRIRHLPYRELLAITSLKDEHAATRQLVASCVVDEQDQPVFASADDVLDAGWPIVKALTKTVQEVNGIDQKAAEKNSPAPQPCESPATSASD